MINLEKIVKDPRVEKVLTFLCSSAIDLSKEISLGASGGNHKI